MQIKDTHDILEIEEALAEWQFLVIVPGGWARSSTIRDAKIKALRQAGIARNSKRAIGVAFMVEPGTVYDGFGLTGLGIRLGEV